MDNPSITKETNTDTSSNNRPSFFQNSSPGQLAVLHQKPEAVDMGRVLRVGLCDEIPKKQSKAGGFTCCVPGCFNNSKRNPALSFYQFPFGNRQEKIDLRKRWISLISRKDFKPTNGHRVCSVHFVGGKKTYMSNVPLIVPKATRPSIPKPRATFKCRNRALTEERFDREKLVEVIANGDENLPEAVNSDNQANELAALRKQMEARERQHKDEIESLTKILGQAKKENESMKAKIKQVSFHVDDIKDDTELFHFYTGFQDHETFLIFFDFLMPAAEKLIYYKSNTNADTICPENPKRGPKRTLALEQELFLVLVRLRCGLLEKDIAYRAGISVGHFSRIFITWIDFLYTRLRQLPIWASRSTIDETMPNAFKEMYPSTRVILDATEIFMEMPSSLRSQSETYSNYKHCNTAKGLLGIAPSGAVTFVSHLYAGRCSDKAVTRDCGILNLLEAGDTIMADKGFNIEDDLPPQTGLNIPPFLKEKASLTLEEETETRRIASLRVHVERAIRRIKTFKLLKTIFPISMSANLDKVWVVCAYLSNFLPPLIAKK
ncbi:uncharacterized protein LOC135693070 [Rhopilema esculentum]|uniref:uncharacterized protein LOC135693070 n=2 Tax=Rhopilema esculentum TaxID=499914 RepID=UPI0031D5C162